MVVLPKITAQRPQITEVVRLPSIEKKGKVKEKVRVQPTITVAL
jgi:hypothetical protein